MSSKIYDLNWRHGRHAVGVAKAAHFGGWSQHGAVPAFLRFPHSFVDTSGLDVQRVAIYRFHAVVAGKWRDGNVFLLGDAAHQMRPFMGQGLCAGVRDAYNFAWKLQAVLQGNADTSLPDTYEDERRPHVQTVVEHAKVVRPYQW